MMSSEIRGVEQAYALAKTRFADSGVDVDEAMRRLETVPISINCWQGDDVRGFEGNGAELGGGLFVTGRYPGRARTPDELRADLDVALGLIPGRHRLNLHASYADTAGAKVERNALEPQHFRRWIDWAKERRLGLDFNPTYFLHKNASDGFTLTHRDDGIRRFWIEHGIACRRIGAAFGQELGTSCITNFWIPDGYKDTPADRKAPRLRLIEALDQIFAMPIPDSLNRDAMESKLFGLGSESYVVGSHEFYLAYAVANKKYLCLDAGHFHPTEMISEKISAVMPFIQGLLLHVSRGVRWDSDHVVTLTDELLAIAQETVRGDYLGKVHIGLDFFDASINRVAAWVIGTRAMQKALLMALLEPSERLRAAEGRGDFTARLALQEEAKQLPYGAIWDYHCLRADVPIGAAWLERVRQYEADVQARR